jgi:hypothetical protein
MSRALKTLIVIAGVLGGVVGMPAGIHGQAVGSKQNFAFPVTIVAFVPCANDGAGEFIQVTGNLHLLTHTVVNQSGITEKLHFQPQGIAGTGVDSGDKYQATGVTQQITHTSSDPAATLTFSFVNNFRMIGQGPRNNLLVHQTVHLTTNARGVQTASVDNFTVTCR